MFTTYLSINLMNRRDRRNKGGGQIHILKQKALMHASDGLPLIMYLLLVMCNVNHVIAGLGNVMHVRSIALHVEQRWENGLNRMSQRTIPMARMQG